MKESKDTRAFYMQNNFGEILMDSSVTIKWEITRK